ncbi:protein LURP-one-related 14-like [Aristolochia californica]|uniref:protein LURP-one-related 14-like n=1 Tax=Aristolochia californica TaxID=171875 RepID=UPI0035D95439
MAAPVSVVNIGFCLSHPVDLVIKPNHGLFSKTLHEVFDARGSLIFRVKGDSLSLHQNRVMYDAAGSPILTMRAKVLSLHQKWTVYRGESSKESDVVFRLKTSKYWTTKLNLDVFLPETREEDTCDFHVESRQSDSCCTIYKGSSIIAEMSEKKGTLAIRVHPGVDYAFITALMVIHSEMKMAQTAAALSSGI